mgnify:CR=1 FL=1
MRKKLFVIFLFILVIYNNINVSYASVINKNYVDIQVPAAVVIDFDTGRVLYDKNGDEKRKMASLTKIMTSILLVENCDMEEQIEVPKKAAQIGGSTVGLKAGDIVTAKSLLYGMLLPSGNDCAYTVAIHLGGTIENFAKMMNDKAKVLGLTSTNFVNPHGLDNENHYTTAKEMAYLTRYALKNPYIDEAVKTKSITINFGSFTKTLNNTNSLLRTYEKADGVKTGFTNGAERCLVSSATDNDRRYICVVLGATTTKIRFNTSKLLLEETFKKYKAMDISNYLKFYINVNVVKGKIPNYEESINDNMSYPLTSEEYDSIYIKQDIVQSLEAPVAAGTKIGKVEVYLENEKLYEKEIFLKENIYKKNIMDYINEALSNMFKSVDII